METINTTSETQPPSFVVPITPTPQKNIYKILFFFVFFILLVVIVSAFFIINNISQKKSTVIPIEITNQTTPTISKTDPVKNEPIIYKEFANSNYTINLINKVENIPKIYAIDISKTTPVSAWKDNLIAHYDNESTLLLATVNGTNNGHLDGRILDFNDNKIYFIIAGDDNGLFEVNYIDLNNLNAGPINLTGFNNMYKKSSLFCLPKGCSPFATEIFIKDNLLYYTEFGQSNDSSILKTYNINSGEVKTISNRKVEWYKFYLDKTHNKLFYVSGEPSSLYISNLDGSNEINLGKDIYNSSSFFSKAIYKNSPIFKTNYIGGNNFSSCDLNTFDYEKNVLVNFAKDIRDFVVKSNSIVYEPANKDVINSFYIAR